MACNLGETKQQLGASHHLALQQLTLTYLQRHFGAFSSPSQFALVNSQATLTNEVRSQKICTAVHRVIQKRMAYFIQNYTTWTIVIIVTKNKVTFTSS